MATWVITGGEDSSHILRLTLLPAHIVAPGGNCRGTMRGLHTCYTAECSVVCINHRQCIPYCSWVLTRACCALSTATL